MQDKDKFRMIGCEQQNEILQQVKQLELITDSDSGLERSTGSSVQTTEENESNKTSEKRYVFWYRQCSAPSVHKYKYLKTDKG